MMLTFPYLVNTLFLHLFNFSWTICASKAEIFVILFGVNLSNFIISATSEASLFGVFLPSIRKLPTWVLTFGSTFLRPQSTCGQIMGQKEV